MIGRRALLLSLLLVTSSLGALPAAATTGDGGSAPLFALPAGTHDLLAAPATDGSVLVAAVTGSDTQLLRVPATDNEPVEWLASYPFVANAARSPLAAPRLAAATPSEAAIAYEAGGLVRAAGLDPSRGGQAFDAPVSLPGEVALHPTVAIQGGSIHVAYYALSTAGARVCVVALDPADGAQRARDCVSAGGAPAPSLAVDGEALYLVTAGASAARVYTVAAGSIAVVGSAPLGVLAGDLTVRGGALSGVVADASSVARVLAPLQDLTHVSRVRLAVPLPVVHIEAAISKDGRLAAVGDTPDGDFVVAEAGLSQYAVSTRPAASGSGAVLTDAFGLAHVFLVEGDPLFPVATGLSVGDPTAMEVRITGPGEVLPAEWATLHVSVKAVRTGLTLAGLAVAGPEGWTVIPEPLTASLAPGQSADSTLRVKAPAGTAPGAYPVQVTPAALESTTPPTSTFAVHVANAASPIGATYSGGPLSLEPGQSEVVGVQVTNRGGAAAITEVRAGSEGSPLFVQPASSTVSLEPGATQTVSFVVTAPASALPTGPTGLRVQVLGVDGSVSAQLDLEAAVLPVFRPELVVAPHAVDAAPGGSVAVPASIVNHGNTPGLVTVSASTLGLPPSSLSVPEHPLLIPAYGTVSAGVTLAVPDHAVAGARYSVSVGAAREDTGAAVDGASTLLGEVLPVVSVEAHFEPGGPVAPGGTTTGTLSLVNDGDRPVTFALTLDAGPSGFSLSLGGAPSAGLVVDPWSTRDIELTLRAARDAPPGLNDLVLTVTSDADGPASVPLPVEVTAVHLLGMRVLTPQVAVHDPAVTSVIVEVALSSGSNAPESVALGFSGPTGALFVLRADGSAVPVEGDGLVVVPPFETTTVRTLVPVGLAPGDTARTLEVTADTLSGLSATGAVSIVRPLADPAVADLRVLPPPREGGVYTVFANLTNRGQSTAAGFTARWAVDGRLVAQEPLTPLAPGVERVISFTFIPRADSQVISLLLASDQPALDADRSNSEASLTYATPGAGPSSPPTLISSEQAVPAAAGLSLLALIGVALTEVGKSTFLTVLFLPLYVKLKPGDVLDQYLRGQIHGYIIANPGEHYNAIKEQLGVTNGALAYHLRVLEKAGYIRATRDGMYKRFYPVGVKIPKRRRLSSFQESIVKTVRDKPALSQKELAELLGVSNQVINYHVKQLEGANIIRLERDGRSSKIFLGPDAPPEEQPAGAPATG